jgi:molybdopterin-guanine dinucleotide biosynthesis protein A
VDEPPPSLGAIVLCGGASARMGRPKAWLPFGDEALLQRVVRVLRGVVEPVVVVAADAQPLPALPADVLVARDAATGRGPLEGLAAGLDALAPRASAAFVVAVDMPFLHAALVRRLAALLATSGALAVVPRALGRDHPLAAAYRVEVRHALALLLAEGYLRARGLLERVPTLYATEAFLLEDDVLRDADPDLRSLRNVNTPADYEAALRLDADPRGAHWTKTTVE